MKIDLAVELYTYKTKGRYNDSYTKVYNLTTDKIDQCITRNLSKFYTIVPAFQLPDHIKLEYPELFI